MEQIIAEENYINSDVYIGMKITSNYRYKKYIQNIDHFTSLKFFENCLISLKKFAPVKRLIIILRIHLDYKIYPGGSLAWEKKETQINVLKPLLKKIVVWIELMLIVAILLAM